MTSPSSQNARARNFESSRPAVESGRPGDRQLAGPGSLKILRHELGEFPPDEMSWGGRLSQAAGVVAKRTFDIVVASTLLVLLAPLLMVISSAVLSSGWPILFRHERVGQGGRLFLCLKFRTMFPDADVMLQRILDTDPEAEAEWRADRKLRNDPRVTPLGRFLRATSMDELPQLLNVICGDMSLVGPRPIVMAELEEFYRPLGGASAYLAQRPGVTGLWQTSGRSNAAYEVRIAHDVTYLRSRSLLGDIAILLRTLGVVLRREGAC